MRLALRPSDNVEGRWPSRRFVYHGTHDVKVHGVSDPEIVDARDGFVATMEKGSRN
jgi:hypothetical protein